MKKSRRYKTSHLPEDQTQPGSRGRVLINIPGIIRKREMDRVEAEEQLRALEEITKVYGASHRFKAKDVCLIHKIWLGKIYSLGAPCSGFRSLITMLSLGVAYVYVVSSGKATPGHKVKESQGHSAEGAKSRCCSLLTAHSSLAKALLLVFSIVPLAFVGNFLRIVALCMITYHFGEEAGQGFFHDFSGIVVFVIMILGLIGLEKILNK